jgi:PAS domain S-box-containing protein
MEESAMEETDPRMDAAALRGQAERKISDAPRPPLDAGAALSPEEVQSLLHELQVHQIELEMQNDELRKAQERLDASRAKYFDLYEMAPVGYCTIGQEGKVLEANLTAAAMLGQARKALVGQQVTRFVAPEDQDAYYLHHKRLFEARERQSYDLRLARLDGTEPWAHMIATIGPDSEGRPVERLVMSDVTERKRIEQRLQRALEEKDILLQEVNYRVKNNLNLILSLLNIQSSAIESSSQAVAAFEKSRDRILAMALVQEELYKSGDYTRVNMSEYLKALTHQLQLAYCPKGEVRLAIETEGIVLSVSQSIPCGLILNELVTNALKYAYPGRRGGEIAVSLCETAEGLIELRVSDSGVGLPEGREPPEGRSLGITIVRLLVKQLDGVLELSSSGGMSYRIAFSRQEGRDEG